MIFGQAIELAQQILVLAALVGVVWSAIAFVRNIARQKEESRTRELKQWQKAHVHEMLHRSERFMSVGDITSQLRSASFDTPVPVGKHELTAAEVRLLLLEMLQSGLVDQLWGDQYGITRRDPRAEAAFQELEAQDIVRSAYDLIQMAPGQLSTDDLMVRLYHGESGRPHDRAKFLLILHELVRKNIARIDDYGMWMTAYPPRKESSMSMERIAHAPTPSP